MRNANVLLDSVTEYLAAWNAATAGSAHTSAGVETGANWRMNVENSALPRKVDWNGKKKHQILNFCLHV